jgi:hypothetical protein
VGSTSLEDVVALTQLSYRYARAIDSRDYDALGMMFMPDATFAYDHAGGAHSDLASWLQGARRLDQLDLTQHFFSNHEFEVAGDQASGRFHMMAQHVRRGVEGGSNLLIGGIYRDTYVRTDDSWRIATRSHETRWATGNPEVLWRWYADLV